MLSIILLVVLTSILIFVFINIVSDPTDKKIGLSQDEKRAIAVNKARITHGLEPKPIIEIVNNIKVSREKYYAEK